MTAGSSTADPRRIPGWDKVAQLAEVLIQLTGIAVSAVQVSQIKALYNGLEEYDKRAEEVHFKSHRQLRGRFCSQKRTGHISREQMRR